MQHSLRTFAGIIDLEKISKTFQNKDTILREGVVQVEDAVFFYPTDQYKSDWVNPVHCVLGCTPEGYYVIEG